ncbi:F-box domain cyclin-like protein [Neofusicoccum parvum]|uniref:F-box domain cyclin-like protein n=1 Tax=Neofusicoccum parvum TaxID=310453 RepID=A0ACB5SG38_9PEZI|nr:F-box domain cyclin-like protein [Neofusicoccum parvum]
MINAKHASGWYDIGLIRDTLAVLQETLEHLQISIILFTSTAIDIGNPGPWGIQASLGDSLRLFSKLRKLEISLPVLLGWNPDGSAKLADILPDCLEELVIGREMDLWYGYKWDDQSAWGFDAADCLAGSAVSHAELKVRQYLQSKPTGLRKLTIIMEDGLSEEDDMRFKNSITQEAEKVGVDVEFNEDSSA